MRSTLFSPVGQYSIPDAGIYLFKVKAQLDRAAYRSCSGTKGILKFCGEKSRGPPTSGNGLMHHLSEIPKQKHLTLPLPIQDKNNRK